ncbi:MAG TPA: hypothetical protein VIY08_12630 [Candidatus Nitrosocosmicus sp.]
MVSSFSSSATIDLGDHLLGIGGFILKVGFLSLVFSVFSLFIAFY